MPYGLFQYEDIMRPMGAVYGDSPDKLFYTMGYGTENSNPEGATTMMLGEESNLSQSQRDLLNAGYGLTGGIKSGGVTTKMLGEEGQPPSDPLKLAYFGIENPPPTQPAPIDQTPVGGQKLRYETSEQNATPPPSASPPRKQCPQGYTDVDLESGGGAVMEGGAFNYGGGSSVTYGGGGGAMEGGAFNYGGGSSVTYGGGGIMEGGAFNYGGGGVMPMLPYLGDMPYR